MVKFTFAHRNKKRLVIYLVDNNTFITIESDLKSSSRYGVMPLRVKAATHTSELFGYYISC